ncbi:cell wall biogenesis glycosyltransferase [soil metagenome]
MPDFYQHKHITTLHQLGDFELEEREVELAEFVQRRPISLVLPALYSEVEQQALPHILSHLEEVTYLDEVVFSMNRMNAGQFDHARRFVGRLPQNVRIIWNDGPRLKQLYGQLANAQLTDYVPGKGYNVWMAYGLILAREDARVIATHDSDILSYHREMLMRICLPTVHPNLGYEYCKSYYGRVTDRMYGRVTRLFVAPLLRAIMQTIGNHPLIEYLDCFRYPLSGEFSISTDLARVLRIPGDWGLEVGMLCEVYRNTTMRRVCQVDLGSNFEHKHQHLGYDPEDPKPSVDKGLMKMAREIALTIFSNLASDGVLLGDSAMKAIKLTYLRLAKETILRYYDDAIVNGLKYFRHEEAAAVEAFARALEAAGADFAVATYEPPQIPNWNRVNSALPHFSEELVEAVDRDNA